MKLERPKGTRDFGPKEEMLRQYIIKRLRKVFQLYGFSPIETPLLEKYEILSAKCAAGEESDAMNEVLTLRDQGKRKLGLRYEQTFQLARYIGMNPQIRMPFKRYQIGRVYRDGPVKLGRYREFWQCDVDIVGCDELIADAEMVSIIDKAFQELDLDVVIEINNRVLLNDILNFVGVDYKKQESLLVSLDKLDKIGDKGVKEELISKGIKSDTIDRILDIIYVKGNNQEVLNKIYDTVGETEGIKQLRELFNLLKKFDIDAKFNPSLVRGLAYYTGPIYEAFLKDSSITSSVAGGGRWDNMIGEFIGSDKKTPATGFAFGLEPIYEKMKRKNIISKDSVTDLFIIPIGNTRGQCVKIMQKLRENGINTDMDFLGKGLSKNLDYTNKRAIPFVIFMGEKELYKEKLKLKEMNSGKEYLTNLEEVIKIVKGEKND